VTSAEPEAGDAFLAQEGLYLARRVFGLALPEPLVWRYVAANQALFTSEVLSGQEALRRSLRRAVVEQLDVEALELALRWRGRANLVSQKVHVLSYLIESEPALAHLYLSERRRQGQAYVVLGLYVLRTAWKYARGRRLLRVLERAP
jgi:enoyl-CoA hydratase/carnithine racemase